MRRRLSVINRASRCQNATKNTDSRHVALSDPRAVSGAGARGAGAENPTKNGTSKPGVACTGGHAQRKREETREAEGGSRSREWGESRSQSELLELRWAGCSIDLADEMRSGGPIRKMHAGSGRFKSSPKREKRGTKRWRGKEVIPWSDAGHSLCVPSGSGSAVSE